MINNTLFYNLKFFTQNEYNRMENTHHSGFINIIYVIFINF